MHIYILHTHTHTYISKYQVFPRLSLQICLGLLKGSSTPQSLAPTVCSPAAAYLPRTSTVVMISSLQCFWQVWLSASLPELNSLHSMQSLQKDTWRGKLSTHQKLHERRDSPLGKGLPGCWSGGCTSAPQGKRELRAKRLHLKDGFILRGGFSEGAEQLVGLGIVCPLDFGSCTSATAKSILPEIKTGSIASLCLSEADAQGTSITARQAAIPSSAALCAQMFAAQGAAKLVLPSFPAEQDSTGNERGCNLHKHLGSNACCLSTWETLGLLSMGSEHWQACLGFITPV